MKNIIQVCLVVLAVSILSCGDEQTYFPDINPVATESSNLKFVHAASDASGVHFYVNDLKVSSGSTTGSSLNFANVFPAVNYASLGSGSLGLKIAIPATASTGEIVLATSSVTAESSHYYTLALAGVSPNYETVLLNDDVATIPFDGKSYVRFVNLIHNSTNKVTVLAKLGTDAEFPIASNIAFKEGVAFIGVTPGDYTIKLVDALDNTKILATISDITLRTLGTNRIYTLYARGQIGQAGTKAPVLDRMINR